MHIVLCYPFFDLRYLIESVPRPAWTSGKYKTVGSFGPVIQIETGGSEAEIRADAALAFGEEQDWRKGLDADSALPAAAGIKKRRFRQRKHMSVAVGDGLTVTSRRMLAFSDGHVRLELVLQDNKASSPEMLQDRLEAALTTKVYVVREEGRPELINAGFNVARLYIRQSAKTAFPNEAVATQLVREGEGSPFVIVVHEGPPEIQPPGTPVESKPDMFDAVTCQLLTIAGRSTGVWQIWGAGRPERWMTPVRILCRIICQLSEATLVTRLEQEPEAFAPYKLDYDRTNRFFRVRSGQLRQTKQGPWKVASIQPLAAQHLRVAIDEALHSRDFLSEFLRRDSAGTTAKTLNGIVETIGASPLIKGKDRNRLVELLSRQAVEDDDYFDRLVDQAELPRSFKTEWAEMNADEKDAGSLIKWALDKKTNPADPSKSTLASLLLPEIDRLALPDAALMVAMISTYRLIHDSDQMTELRIRYQSPLPAPSGNVAVAVGPKIDWRGPADSELQSWLSRDPIELDMGYLAKAVEHAASVCLVSVPASGETGTGVLIGERLALTNYHVVKAVIDGGLNIAEAAKIELTFGKFGEGTSTISTTLDETEPILDWSPTDQLDFALLRLSKAIGSAENPRAASLSAVTPKLRSALNILQHPRGGDMKLVPSDNAVAYVNPKTGVIQYLTQTAKGSSGAPCFDDQWEVAAIHHAELSRTFGVIREGILISPIREKISKYIN